MSEHTPGHTPGHNPVTGHSNANDNTQEFGDVKVSTGSQAAYISVELIVYILALLGIFITAAVIDEEGPGPGFSASQAWFYATLLTVGYMVSRGLAKINGGRRNSI